MQAKTAIDWTGCPLVEINPEKMSGAPILKGTRLTVKTITDNAVAGLTSAEIAEQFEVEESKVKAILDFQAAHRKPTRRLRVSHSL